jgi:hypothetical protein
VRLPLEPGGLAGEDAQEEQGQLEGEDAQEELLAKQGQLDQLLVDEAIAVVEAFDGHFLLDHVERDVFEPRVPCGVVRFLQMPKPRASGETATIATYNLILFGPLQKIQGRPSPARLVRQRPWRRMCRLFWVHDPGPLQKCSAICGAFS